MKLNTLLAACTTGLLITTGLQAKSAEEKFEADRKAILSMAGKFTVDFHFEENLPIQADYKLKRAYHEDADELVIVVEDTGKKITLQHLLVVSAPPTSSRAPAKQLVVKHWAQTWKYEDQALLEYVRGTHWVTTQLPEDEVKGKWTQYVSQVDDSPRYEGIGEWRHFANSSIWESREAARPLPRREYTKRSDYDVVLCTNRHVISAAGWAHEQHNSKLIRREGQPESIIAHEIGLNTYVRMDDIDFTVATEYWEKHGAAWGKVRAAWDQLFTEKKEIHYHEIVDDVLLRNMITNTVKAAGEEEAEPLEISSIETKIRAYLQ